MIRIVPDTNIIISCAYDGVCTYIITGDPDLLVLKTFKSITMLTAAEFLEIIKK